ncbi:MAG: hypothetical protein JW744_04175 [Candidatus Diapherotrites archaeon]|uniref:Trimeric autotransporter adhesin YadA-like head domain-containing protein n=1 Tax=Candidatus Iainarchaeum sp. TaxID=3101447 RepID=A0A939C6N5_9ARCH|nr:hypothetical protein [Candidatus Diapherotrites archaeon]
MSAEESTPVHHSHPTMMSLQGKVEGVTTGDLGVKVGDQNSCSSGVFFDHNYSNAIQESLFNLLLGSQYDLNLNYNQDYYMCLYVNGELVDGPQQFRGGQGQVDIEDVNAAGFATEFVPYTGATANIELGQNGIVVGEGAEAAPSIASTTNDSTGIWFDSGQFINFSIDGAEVVRIQDGSEELYALREFRVDEDAYVNGDLNVAGFDNNMSQLGIAGSLFLKGGNIFGFSKLKSKTSTASGNYSTSLGYYSTASGLGSIAAGYTATPGSTSLTASGPGSMAFGYAYDSEGTAHITSSGEGSFAAGNSYPNGGGTANLTASGDGAIAMGYITETDGQTHSLLSEGKGSISLGTETHAHNDGSVALGYKADASQDYAVAIGYKVFSPVTRMVALGTDVNVVGALVTGPNMNNNLANGDINASTIYYDSLSAKSPHFFEEEPSVGYTRFCVKDTAGYYNLVYWSNGQQVVETNSQVCADKKAKIETKRAQELQKEENIVSYEAARAACESRENMKWTGTECVQASAQAG